MQGNVNNSAMSVREIICNVKGRWVFSLIVLGHVAQAPDSGAKNNALLGSRGYVLRTVSSADENIGEVLPVLT